MRACVLALLVLLGLPFEGLADLDVRVPPGLPPDWAVPQPELSSHLRVPARRDGGSVTLVAPPRMPAVRPQSAFDFAGIITVDLSTELPWADRRPRPATGNAYPPAESGSLYWLALATMLRTAFHPTDTSLTATREHLIMLGHPAYLAARHVARERSLSKLAAEIVRAVGPLPKAAPVATAGKTGAETMLLRLAVRELSAGHPYDPETTFAPRLRALGPTGLAAVLACSRHRHTLVRRNAVAMLGHHAAPAASQRLRELITDPDAVVRNRAIAALAARRDDASADRLVALMGDRASPRGARVVAADALGRLVTTRSGPALRRFAAASEADPSALLAALGALGRLGARDPETVALLRRYQAWFGRRSHAFKQRNALIPDNKSLFTKAEVVTQVCRIALAGCGDADASAALVGEPPTKVEDDLKAALREMSAADREWTRAPRELQSWFEHQSLRAKTRADRASLTALYRQRLALHEERMTALRKASQKAYEQVTVLFESWRQERLAMGRRRQELGLERYRWQRGALVTGVETSGIATPNKFLALTVLARLDAAGHGRLLRIAEDPTEDAVLRAEAIRLLDPAKLAAGVAKKRLSMLGRRSTEPSRVRARALIALAPVDAAAADGVARAILTAYMDAGYESLPAQRHWATIPALEWLGRRGAIDAVALLKVVAQADRERAFVRDLKTLRATRKRVPVGTRRHKQLETWYVQRSLALPAVLEVALRELGREGTAQSSAALVSRVAIRGSAARGAAVIALGAFDDAPTLKRLLALTGDGDGWVRLCAARVLAHRSGIDADCDWIHGDFLSQASAVERWRAWLAARR